MKMRLKLNLRIETAWRAIARVFAERSVGHEFRLNENGLCYAARMLRNDGVISESTYLTMMNQLWETHDCNKFWWPRSGPGARLREQAALFLAEMTATDGS